MKEMNKGSGFWRDIPTEETASLPQVTLPGNKGEESINPDDPEPEVIRKIRSWVNVAILGVERYTDTNKPVYCGFATPDFAQRYTEALDLYGEPPFENCFAVRIGDGDVTFFVMSDDPALNLTHIATLNIEDSSIPEDFPLY